jgi:hypothetical protein
MLRKFATGAIAGMVTACGTHVDNGGNAGAPNAGGSPNVSTSTVSTGGTFSYSTGAAGGSMSASTGGSTAVDMQTICDGMLANLVVCPNSTPQIILNAATCDIPLQWSPTNVKTVIVMIDCAQILQVTPDAGTANGYYLDYNQSPAHLELTGATCTAVVTHGPASVLLFEWCHTTVI